MIRLSSLLVCLAFSGCATEVVTTGVDASTPPLVPAGLYHQPGEADAINLELSDDNTFRWSLLGCDTFGGDSGRVLVVSDSQLKLLPAEGETEFLWAGTVVVARVPEITLEIQPGKLVDSTSQQLWISGGVCPICGGNLGPTGQEACDEPTFFDQL
jgi:hypothetical protein